MDDSPPVSTFSGLLDGLARIEQKLARIERRLDTLEQLPNIVAVATDTLDQHANQLQMRGIDLDERAQSALMLLEHITDPNTTQLLTRMLAFAEQAPDTLAMLVDSIDQRVAALDGGNDLSERVTTLARIAERVTSPSALELVGRAGEALTLAQQTVPHPVGAFGLLRALSDRDVQHALGFAFAFAREFGRSLEPGQTPKALPTSS